MWCIRRAWRIMTTCLFERKWLHKRQQLAFGVLKVRHAENAVGPLCLGLDPPKHLYSIMPCFAPYIFAPYIFGNLWSHAAKDAKDWAIADWLYQQDYIACRILFNEYKVDYAWVRLTVSKSKVTNVLVSKVIMPLYAIMRHNLDSFYSALLLESDEWLKCQWESLSNVEFRRFSRIFHNMFKGNLHPLVCKCPLLSNKLVPFLVLFLKMTKLIPIDTLAKFSRFGDIHGRNECCRN